MPGCNWLLFAGKVQHVSLLTGSSTGCNWLLFAGKVQPKQQPPRPTALHLLFFLRVGAMALTLI